MTVVYPFDFDTRDPVRALEALKTLLNRPGFLERTYTMRLSGQTWQGVELSNYRRSSTTTFESHYACGQENATALATANPAVGTLIAVPFVADSPFSWDRLEFEVTTGAAGLARVGIYAATTIDGAMYPGNLIIDGGEYDVSGAGVKSTTITPAYVPTEGRLYFAVYLCGTANPTIRAIPVGGIGAAMGLPSTLGTAAQIAYTVASTYSTASGLPVVFPSGATAHTTAVPAVFLRLVDPVEFTRTYPADIIDREGFMLRRVLLVSTQDILANDAGPYFTVTARMRSADKADALDVEFDSRVNSLAAGEAFSLTGQADIDLILSEDDVPEVEVTQYGRPVADLSGLLVRATTSYVGD